jgi:hypothetical protein
MKLMKKKLILLVLLFPSIVFGQFTLSPECTSCISIEKDKFTGKTTYESPYNRNIDLYRIDGTKYLTLKTYSSFCTVSIDKQDLILLFEDGTKHIVQCTFNTSVSSGNSFMYISTFTVNSTLSNLMKTKKLVAFKLYIFDVDLDATTTEQVIKSANCVY